MVKILSLGSNITVEKKKKNLSFECLATRFE